MAYMWVPLKRVSCTCHGCKCFQAHSCLLSFSYCFFFKKLARGHCPGVVTSGGNVTNKHFTEMRRLACDETPFFWQCHQEPLPWFGDQIYGSVIPLHAHGLIGWLLMRPPILQLGFVLLFLWVPLILAEKLFTAFLGIPGRSISRFILWLLSFASYFYPMGL